MTRNELVAMVNMNRLGDNPYPGRGIVIGMNRTGEFAVQIYWIMGRSPNSRNRVFTYDVGGRVFTEPADPAKVEDPSLIIYNAMREVNEKCHLFVVSNGSQTDNVAAGGLLHGLSNYKYEPDAPNFTPRITGICLRFPVEEPPEFALAILRKSLWDDTCDRHFYNYARVGNGFGYCITTYAGDGNPLPSFTGEPWLMPLEGNIETIALTYWEALNKENRVALAVKFIPVHGGPSSTRVINKYEKVG